jgi:hypothetical protein
VVLWSGLLTAVFAAATTWFAANALTAGPERVVNAAHALMGVAMVGMLWSWGMAVPGWLEAPVLGTVAICFLRRTGADSLHHALTAATMTWMVAAMSTAGMPASGGGLMAVLGVPLAGYFLVSGPLWMVLRRNRARLDALSHAAMSLGMAGVLIGLC